MYSSVSANYGALPFLGELWELPPLFVFFVVLGIDYGVISALMKLENAIKMPQTPRQKYLTFRVNDTVVIPPFLALCAWIMQDHPSPQGWYTDRWWHWTALLGSFGLSLVIELLSIKAHIFTWRQEISPSKLYHTLIFGVMGYWMLTGLVAGFANRDEGQWWGIIDVLVAVWVCVVVVWEPALLRQQGRKTPVNAHPEVVGRKLRWPDDPT